MKILKCECSNVNAQTIMVVNGLIANVNGQFDFSICGYDERARAREKERERERERERETLLAYDYLHMPMMTNFATI